MKHVLILFLSLLMLSLLLSITWLMTSESGLRWTYRQIQHHLPGDLQIGEISGSLAGGIALRAVRFDDGSIRLGVDRLLLDWNPWALLQVQVEISRVDIDSVDLQLLSATADSSAGDGLVELPTLDMPLPLTLEHVAIDRLSLRQADESYQLNQVRMHAEARGNQVRIEHLDLILAGVVIDEQPLDEIVIGLWGSVGVAGTLPHDLHIDWKTALPDGVAVDSTTTLQGNVDVTQINHHTSGPLSGKLQLELRDPLQDLRWKGSLRLSDIDTTVFEAEVPPLRGSLDLDAEGDLQSAIANGSIEAETSEIGKFSGRFELATLAPERVLDGLLVKSLDLVLLDGEIMTKGELYWSPTVAWNSAISVRHINPAALLPEWPGDLSADFDTEGQFENGKLDAGVSIESASGSLRGYPLSVAGKAHWRDETLAIESAALSSGETQIQAKGSIGETLALDWSVDSENLAEIHPDALGQLKASGQLGGSLEQPQVEATFRGRSIRLMEYAAAAVDGDIAIDLQNWQQLELHLQARDLELQGQRLQSIDLDADKSRIDARLAADGVSARVELAGELRDQAWQGQLLDADIDSNEFDRWRLQSPVSLSLSAEQINIETLCLMTEARARICGQVHQREADWDIDFDAATLPLGTVAALDTRITQARRYSRCNR